MLYDVIVIGSGLVGASLALRLSQAGLKVAVIEARQPSSAVRGDQWDSRIYALSPGSVEFLVACGAWQYIDNTRIMQVEDMRVFGDDVRSELDFSAYEAGLRELAVIVENGQVQAALSHALRERTDVELMVPASCAAMTIGEDVAQIELTDGRTLRARLVVGADGGDSWVRGAAGIAVEAHPYGQTAVVANFECDKPHRSVAHQWFRRDGILALLPLPGNRVSMVWSTRDEHAAELMALPHGELAAQVATASAQAVGELKLITAPALFTLRLQRVREIVKPRLALVGDAAHNVHPLAGQGVNLGFRDARQLAGVLRERGAQTDCGNYQLLRQYERARREDVAVMQLATDSLQRLFNNDDAMLAPARNLGLRITNRLSGLKNFLMQQAVG